MTDKPIIMSAESVRAILAGRTVVEDVNGGSATQTAIWKLKRKMFVCRYPEIDFRVVEK